jgi:glucose/arabinose dehydrogenase
MSTPRMCLSRWLVAAAVAAFSPTLLSAQVVLPPGFVDVLITDAVNSPTALAFTPDGRLLVTEQTGAVRVYAGGAVVSTPAIDLGLRICTDGERGLLGVAVHPDFARTRLVYLYYTHNKFGSCGKYTSNVPVNRVARFVLGDDNVIDPASEQILIDNIPNTGGNHNAGDLHFGADGFLYISVGDGACDYDHPTRCGGSNDASRDPHILLGKVLRVTDDGRIPATNPFQGPGTARCALTGRTMPGLQCQETFARGFRNPFRMAFDPTSATTRFVVNDVGQNHFEEVNLIEAGGDYGWNTREGPCVSGSFTDCGEPPAGMTNPLYSYAHGSGCGAITGGAFVPSGAWPAEYDGAYLFGDFNCGRVFRLRLLGGNQPEVSVFADGLGLFSMVAATFGPRQGQQALYYTTYGGGGAVRAIVPIVGNQPPVVEATATPLFGPTPLTVAFDASASTDPNGDPLTFEWNFGDGSPVVHGAAVSHTYAEPGTRAAEVVVSDGVATSRKSLRIDAGNTPPSVKILEPAPDFRFSVGQTIVLKGSATDAEDGALTNLSWRVMLHHLHHTHPFLPPTAGGTVTIVGPAPEDLLAAASSYLEIELTATDSAGLATIARQTLLPLTVPITLSSVPGGLRIDVNETTVNVWDPLVSWAGWGLDLHAPSQKDPASGNWLIFDSWSDGGAATHRFVTPAAPAALQVAYKDAPNLALNRPVVSSTTPNAFAGPARAVDGNAATSWIGGFQQPQLLILTLSAPHVVERAILRWGTSHASTYAVWLSANGVQWRLFESVSDGDGAVDDLVAAGQPARFVALVVNAGPGPLYGLSEIELYGRPVATAVHGTTQR